ncbi:REP-associated tyrosine transposase [Texcoconibacillus texcoconensis]|uniref:REP element-mobilizing transposase RayT n=1 Tax=Texcoconibacillus texcoconensis TaxID=1095777 RepID=A0A840QQY5_9BACI|nr:transposase [Texcoconibacillus texcoconensis]MBB5173866.1 REP element-mobilizing transposase RayT [Texcoconibacillus texcoconensis]
MPRKRRVTAPGAIFHITSRGNRRDLIFIDERDYLRYLKLLERVQEVYPFYLHAYCLMPNHIHLLLETVDSPTSKIISNLHTRYAMYFNRRYDVDGHLFQGRYHAQLIDSLNYFLRVSKYIHLNPVTAKMVDFPEHYPWSSYPHYYQIAPEESSTQLVTTDKILSHFSEPKRENYFNFIDAED